MHRLLLALLLASSCVCGPTTSVPDGGNSDGGADCFDDNDCPSVPLFFCNTSTSRCEPGCAAASDCTATVRKQFALPECAGSLGCQCDMGRCAPALCARDADCTAPQVCRNGACAAPPAASSVAGCSISPDYVVLRQGSSAPFGVLAWDAQKNPVVTPATWSAVGTAGTVAGNVFTATTPTADATTAVQATVGAASCTARVRVLSNAAPAPGELTVLVTDALSGRPVANASVLASAPGTGAAVGAPATTDAQGLATLTGLGTTTTVSVFHPDFGYLTVAGYDLAGTRVLSLPLRRNPYDRFGGQRGTVAGVPNTSNLHLGLTGLSMPALTTDLALTDLSFAPLVGRGVPTRIAIGSSINSVAPLASGLFLGFTNQTIKPTVASLGQPGVCADETATAAGTCGTRTAWGFTGDLPLGDVPLDQFVDGFGGVNFLPFFQRIGPLFWKFQSSVVRDVPFTLSANGTLPDGGYRFTDPDGGIGAFTSADHAFAATPVRLDLSVQIPQLPTFRGRTLDTTVLFGGVAPAGRGFVPLGMGVSPAGGFATPGRLSLRSAPPHHGLEGMPYRIAALALRTLPDALASSALVAPVADSALAFDPAGKNPVSLGTAGFPPIPDTGAYDFLGTRAFTFATPPTPDPLASLIRVVFTDQAEHRWEVWMDASKTADGFHLPTPPGTFGDRTFFLGLTSGPRAPYLVQRVRLDVPFAQAVELSASTDLLSERTTGFALVDHPRPAAAWVIPALPNQTVPKGSAVVVRVRGVSIPTEGFVRLSFSPATAGCPEVDGTTDGSNGKGEIVLTVPNTCVLANATMTATLMTPAGTPLLPPVASALTANVQ